MEIFAVLENDGEKGKINKSSLDQDDLFLDIRDCQMKKSFPSVEEKNKIGIDR